jgi:heme-degrading monooxygenase HmoA
MIVILFRSKLTAAAGDGYNLMSDRMLEYAQGSPGFVEVRNYTSETGERLTVVWWKDQEMLRRWREDPRHRVAQETGRKHWYEYYDMEVAEVVRESRFVRTEEIQ